MRGANKYGLSQADFYQLFAYGQNYLAGQGAMVLIYPFSKMFGNALPVFDFDKSLSLWALPFDLDAGCVVDGELAGLPLRKLGLPYAPPTTSVDPATRPQLRDTLPDHAQRYDALRAKGQRAP